MRMYQLKQETYLNLDHVIEIARTASNAPGEYSLLRLSDGKTIYFLSEDETKEILECMMPAESE